MKYHWFMFKIQYLNEYVAYMLATILFLAIGTCQIIPNYGILNGELRTYNEQTSEIGEYLGGV